MTIGKRNVRGWLVCYAFVLAFALVMVPSLAYADTYVATEDSAVRAAMVYLGYDPDEGESTNKLVTAFYDATSGDVYTGWQSFVNGLYQPLDTVNYNEQWWSPADGFMFSAQVDRARADAAKIYAAWKSTSGGGSGGGSGGFVPDEGGYLSITCKLGVSYWSNSGSFKVNGVTYKTGLSYLGSEECAPDECTVKIPVSIYEEYGENYDIFAQVNSTNLGAADVIVYAFPKEQYTITTLTYSSSGKSSDYIKVELPQQVIFYKVLRLSNLTSWVFTFDSIELDRHNTNINQKMEPYWGQLLASGGGTDPEPEPEPEPEPPVPPDPPVDPTPPTPDPTQPSQTIDLQGIIDRLDIIIRNQVVLINWLDDAFASVTANIQWLGELIDESFGWLWDVLGNLQSSIDSGINRITTWLEMIYRKIGGQGGTVSRPNIDTPTPWDDFLNWLKGILQRLLDLIFGVTPAALQQLLSGLADLTSKFPFSIPWDLAALFALFAHEPVTPVADIPLMVPFANAPLSVHVDCTVWDGLAAIMRDGETILFAAWLVMVTPNFYRHLNNVSGAD